MHHRAMFLYRGHDTYYLTIRHHISIHRYVSTFQFRVFCLISNSPRIWSHRHGSSYLDHQPYHSSNILHKLSRPAKFAYPCHDAFAQPIDLRTHFHQVALSMTSLFSVLQALPYLRFVFIRKQIRANYREWFVFFFFGFLGLKVVF